MFDFYEKRKLAHILYSKPFLVFLSFPVLFMGFATWNARVTAQSAYDRRVELAAELAYLEERAQLLEQDVRDLADPRGVEAAMRKRYEVGRAGEELIILVEDEMVVETDSTPVPKPTLWERVTEWF